jgi:hypothetical protein
MQLAAYPQQVAHIGTYALPLISGRTARIAGYGRAALELPPSSI